MDALVQEEIGVTRRVDVLHQGKGDVCIDVILGSTRRIVGAGFLPIDGAPREQHTIVGKLQSSLLGSRQHVVTETQRVTRKHGIGVTQERQYVDFRVPEVMPAITRSGHALGGNAAGLRAGGGLNQLEEIPAHGLLDLWLAGDFDVGPLPKARQPFRLVNQQIVEAHRLGAVEGAGTAERQFLRGHVAGRVVAHELL